MSTTTRITADEFDSMSFDCPVELIRGEIVEMTDGSGIHASVCANLTGVLWSWSRSVDGFQVLSNDPGVQTRSDPDSVRCPDVSIVSTAKLGSQGLTHGRLRIAPEVVVEVKSPSNRWRELVAKSVEFLAAGVNEVWIIDPESRHVHIYQEDTEPTILTEEDTIGSQFLPEFSCEVGEFFRNVSA